MEIKAVHIRTLLILLVMICGGFAIGEGYKSYKQQQVLHEWWQRMTAAEQSVEYLKEQRDKDTAYFKSALNDINVKLDSLVQKNGERH